jgi:AraC-like DNA-binding protein
VRLSAIVLICGAGILAGARADAAPVPRPLLDLPHRSGPITLDGRLDDWRGPRLEMKLTEPEVGPPLANTGTFFLVWDATHLWFAADIEDHEVHEAPPSVSGASLYQWDSIEVYIDGHGDRAERLGDDDTQIIVASDGRHAVLQGDALLRTIEGWQVPKREQPGLRVRTAARRSSTGYVIEGAFPVAATGVAEARRGQILAVDVAWNDWIEDHPRLPELLKDLESLARLVARDDLDGEPALTDPDSVGWGGLLAWEERAYRPWSWSNGRDFGHPRTWQPVRLVGRPPLGERLAGRWGVGRLLAGLFVVVLGLAVVGDLALRHRQRRRIRELLATVAALQAQQERPSVPSAGPDARLDDPVDLPSAPPDVAARLLAHVREHLAEPLTVTEVAAALGVSTRTLQRECRQALDASPREAILAVKMRAACDLLATGRWRVGEVAEQVGFDSPYHFSRRFKDVHGVPPSAVVPARPDPSPTPSP